MKSRFYVCLIFVGVSSALCAETDGEKSSELLEVHAQRQQVSADVKKLAEEKSSQIEQLRKLEKQYGEQLNFLNKIKLEIKQQELVLQTVRDKIASIKQDLQHQRRGLEGLVKSAYAMGDMHGVDLLLNQTDPGLSGRLLIYHDYISKARVQKLKVIEEDVKSLQQLESQKNTETELLHVSFAKKQQEADELKALRSQREKLLNQIDHDYSLKQQQLVNLMHDEKKLETLLASFQKTDDNAQHSPNAALTEIKPLINKQSSQPKLAKPIDPAKNDSEIRKDFADLQGQLPWPVQGAIVERFGSQRFETTWDGIVIGAHEGADIHAIASGRVVYSDWLRGYGLLIIVDHGNGFMSLYAFNQNLHKNVGDQVKTGDSLASVGRSGGRSQASLYFGIRKKGRAVDPEKWCRKPGKG